MIADSQLKYIRGENLSTRDTYVEVNSASGAKVQQVPDLFSQELEDPTVSQIIVHIGTNSAGETSTEHLNKYFENLDAIELCFLLSLNVMTNLSLTR